MIWRRCGRNFDRVTMEVFTACVLPSYREMRASHSLHHTKVCFFILFLCFEYDLEGSDETSHSSESVNRRGIIRKAFVVEAMCELLICSVGRFPLLKHGSCRKYLFPLTTRIQFASDFSSVIFEAPQNRIIHVIARLHQSSPNSKCQSIVALESICVFEAGSYQIKLDV